MWTTNFCRTFFIFHFVVHEQSAVKSSFSTYVCYDPDGLFWLQLQVRIFMSIQFQSIESSEFQDLHTFPSYVRIFMSTQFQSMNQLKLRIYTLLKPRSGFSCQFNFYPQNQLSFRIHTLFHSRSGFSWHLSFNPYNQLKFKIYFPTQVRILILVTSKFRTLC